MVSNCWRFWEVRSRARAAVQLGWHWLRKRIAPRPRAPCPPEGAFFARLAILDFNALGYLVVALFLAS
jgi:hypothetical protein